MLGATKSPKALNHSRKKYCWWFLGLVAEIPVGMTRQKGKKSWQGSLYPRLNLRTVYESGIEIEGCAEGNWTDTWVVVKIMVPFGVPILIRHLLFRVPKKVL